ncbi:hypothetical protein PBI_TERROR_55 [Mycobacterium phage Terror]|uniref:DNA-binding phage zinc finger domain-containing protein n=2 Tax=Liefievirus TaxID=1623288 RepID=A0A481VT85_9CAUD|nr:hypothetical protein BI023_gp59 [Mycobacterium phage Sneeze]YP_010051340.1 hypothetical protein KDW70_gp55 [Mycobacterium phage Taheera]YP_010051405.1 hypothetical protein KDW71_gp60 [Mycobacterium phage Rabbs]AOT25224.1 hypothetical protein PBI_TERROR_55 [Mycobacterium phage Terror]UUG69239.1 hypothetical protein SEA_BARKLEY26_56 [Mycobacterium phage Barkley26]ANU79765.1 hypothetical protein SEA_SNEEZE_59 [Mycobacterium phage Sneeze]AOT25166.1 hypothetical protein PBI_TAHEERA_55 [Mycobact
MANQTARDPLAVACPICAADPGESCRSASFPSLIVEHQARRESAAPPVGHLFSRTDTITRYPCPRCGDMMAETNRGPVHFEILLNGAKTVYRECRTGDQGALFGIS